MDSLDRRLQDRDDIEGILQILRILQRLGLSREDLQVRLERTRAVNDTQQRDQVVEDNCLLALDIVLGYAGDISLRWDARETARLLIPRCLSDEQLHDAISLALARSDMLPPRRNVVPVENIQTELGPVLSERLRNFELAPQPASFFRVPKDRFVTRPAALLAPNDRVCFEALADMIAPVFDSAAPSNVIWPRTRQHVEHSSFAQRPVDWDYPYIVSADIERFYENVDHGRLALVLAGELRANSVFTRTVEALLDSVMSTNTGLPQGPPASEIFASCYLLLIDKHLIQQGIDYVRYMDDYRFGAHSVLDARIKLEALESMLRDLGLSLNASKTWPYKAETYRGFVDAGPSAREQSLQRWFDSMVEHRVREADNAGELEGELRSLGVEDQEVWDALYHGTMSLEEIIEDLRGRLDQARANSFAALIPFEAARLRQKIVRRDEEDSQSNLNHAFIYLASAEVWIDWADVREVMLWYPALARTVAAYLTALAARYEGDVRAALADWLSPQFDTDWVQCWACSVAEASAGLVDDTIAARLVALCAAGASVPLTAAEATRALAAAHRLDRASWESAHSTPAVESELYLDTKASPSGYPWLSDSAGGPPTLGEVADTDQTDS
ncbi:RNA-directed DNA polymerase [Virgisporangium aurantiacum]|uniref:RNA-directed DNA polymerase n=1 Tax=Virgisporangium aurantiacum TaxID=175570 RepID=UPI0019519997|nr:RNA-directed DNA polymerase [Virgisporangium aurantiacum]